MTTSAKSKGYHDRCHGESSGDDGQGTKVLEAAFENLHVLGRPKTSESIVVSMRRSTRISLTESLEEAKIGLSGERVVIDFSRVRGGQLVLDFCQDGPETMFEAMIRPHDGREMSAFDALFFNLSTEIDIELSDVAWLLTQVVEVDSQEAGEHCANADLHRSIAAE